MARLALLLCAMATLPLVGQSPLLQHATSLAESYRKDITELPLQVTTVEQSFDRVGTLRKTRRSSHRFTLTQARAGRLGAQSQFSGVGWVFHRRRMLEQTLNDSIALAPALVFSPQSQDIYRFSEAAGAQLRFESSRPCSTFREISAKTLKMDFCGTGELLIDASATPELRRFSFRPGGMPLEENGRHITEINIEESFRAVNVAGSKRQFVVPERIVVTSNTDTGKVVLTSDYTPAETLPGTAK